MPFGCVGDDDDMDIDVCLGCGRYYFVTPMLEEAWRESFNYREGAVMDQLCWGCTYSATRILRPQ